MTHYAPMVTYYNKEEFAQVVVEKLTHMLHEDEVNVSQEFSTIYFDKSPDIEYGVRGKAVLKTSYNENGYFIKTQKQ